MVKYQRKTMHNQFKKSKDYQHHLTDEDEESCLGPSRLNSCHVSSQRAKLKLFYLLVLCLVSCILVLATLFVSFNSCLLHSSGVDEDGLLSKDSLICSSGTNGSLCCDRSSRRSDYCVMKGDVRTNSASKSLILYNANGLSHYISDSDPSHDRDDDVTELTIQHEKIRPYTRKWETSVMETIDELTLIAKKKSGIRHRCDVHHNVPAVFFSTGGYTGNLYHEFNDGILPLYITSQHFNKKVVFVILEYHNWWITKYGDILSQLSDFPPVDFTGDKRVHCFPEAVVGLRIHGELTIEPSLIEGNRTMRDLHDILDRAYWPRIKGLVEDEEREAQAKMAISPSSPQLVTNPIKGASERNGSDKPKLVIVSRTGSRSVTNEGALVKMAEDIGFEAEVLKPQKTTELAKVYRALNSSDVMIGVHGAAMTHFLFMKPGSVFIQIVPLGTKWAAETYYGEPVRKFGLKYIGYEILPQESSLYDEYDANDPVLKDPSSVNHMGWEYTKKIYLDRQVVRLDLRRFQKRLLRSYYYTVARKHSRLRRLSQ